MAEKGIRVTMIVLHLLSAAMAAVVLGIAAAIVDKVNQAATPLEQAAASRFNYSSAGFVLFAACSGFLVDVALAVWHMVAQGGALLFLVERILAILWMAVWMAAGIVVSSPAVAWRAWWTTQYPWLSTYAAMVAFTWFSWIIWIAMLIMSCAGAWDAEEDDAARRTAPKPAAPAAAAAAGQTYYDSKPQPPAKAAAAAADSGGAGAGEPAQGPTVAPGEGPDVEAPADGGLRQVAL